MRLMRRGPTVLLSPLQILVVFLEVIFASQKSRVDLARFVSGEYFIDDCSEMEEGFIMTHCRGANFVKLPRGMENKAYS